MKNLILTTAALLFLGTAFSQTNPTRDTLVTGKKADTTLTYRDNKNTLKDALKTKDHTKVTRQKTTTSDTTTATKIKKRKVLSNSF